MVAPKTPLGVRVIYGPRPALAVHASRTTGYAGDILFGVTSAGASADDWRAACKAATTETIPAALSPEYREETQQALATGEPSWVPLSNARWREAYELRKKAKEEAKEKAAATREARAKAKAAAPKVKPKAKKPRPAKIPAKKVKKEEGPGDEEAEDEPEAEAPSER